MVGRLTQSLFDPGKLRLHIYTDDPTAIMRGSEQERRLMMTKLILIWRALGFDLAIHKGRSGCQVEWVGHELKVGARARTVSASVKG